MKSKLININQLSEKLDEVSQIRRKDLSAGVQFMVFTKNSSYKIRYQANGLFDVSGGWFERKKIASPIELGISGCTWGRSAIKGDIIAALGMNIEFENRLVTSAVEKIGFIVQEK